MSRKKKPEFPAVTYAVVGECSVRLWPLSSEQRLARQLALLRVTQRTTPAEAARVAGPLLLLRPDHLFQDRTFVDLLNAPNTLLRAGEEADSPVVAAHVSPEKAAAGLDALRGGSTWQSDPDLRALSPRGLSSAYLRKLRKLAPPEVHEIRADRVDALELYLFGSAYKGITDMITKWVWPTPARWVAKLCAERGIGPNAVTSVSLLLTVVAVFFFGAGWFGVGLALAWTMTFLDTVDGKLARVTVNSTDFGHLFDHIIDIVGPPVWYLAWLYASPPVLPGGFDRMSVAVVILAGYIVGRLIEGLFNWGLAEFTIYIWRPIDSYGRLVIARRNPNLIFLTAACLSGRPDVGIVVVAAWTTISTLFLTVRLAQGALYRVRVGKPRSWIDEVGASGVIPRLARPFL